MKLCFLCIVQLIYINCDQIPRTILPIKYDLTITPYFETESDSYFSGYLVFTFKPLKHNQVERLALHVDGLDIDSYTLLENGSKVEQQQDVIRDPANQHVYFDYGQPLSVDNNYELRVNYSGRISEDGWGLFKGVYEHENKKRFFTATQLRPIFARRLLPCLDEPAYKAHFTVRVWRLPQYTARSNMPLVDTYPKSLTTGRVLDTFAETPLMSTFLLALVVFDFSSLSSPDGRFTSWTVPTNLPLVEHGQRLVPGLVKAMEVIAGCEFPLPKMDQIALPQLNPVAMENWGMNTYREVNILYKEGMFAPIVRQNVPRFTGHEVAHHWLGNLVTLEWWNWLWISEMYAMYYEYYLPSQIKPLWKMADQMVVSLVIPGLLEDSFNNSRPLTTNVSTNQEILAKFSGVTYTKGPALVRMIDGFMTHSQAERALKNLIDEKKYGIVTPTELWKIYNRHAESLPADMETIMRSWTDQPGYPLVTVTTNHSAGTITLQQSRFLLEGTDSASLWWIPLTFTGGNRPNFTNTRTRIWLTPETPLTTVKLGRHIESWVIFNIQEIGFYRVDYDLENWQRLTDSLLKEPAGIHELNRAQLLDDSLALARAGKQPYHLPLRLASYLRQELCFSPWAAFIPSANFLLTRFNGHAVYENLREFMRHLVNPVYNHVGFYIRTTDPHLLQMNRVQIVTFACSIGLPACVSDAKSHEDRISQGNLSEIPPGLEFTQLCTVLESGKILTNWTHKLSFWSLEDQVRTMPCAADKTILIRYLTKSLQEDSAAEWRVKLMASITRPANINPVFALMIDQFQNLLTKFGSQAVADYFTQVGNLLSTRSQLAELAELNAAVNDTEIANSMRTVSLALFNRLRWVENLTTSLQAWLDDFHLHKNDVKLSSVQCS